MMIYVWQIKTRLKHEMQTRAHCKNTILGILQQKSADKYPNKVARG